jgi:GH15 family glucan-1,4-alpha-glucosidase
LPIRQLEPLGEHALRYAFEPDSGIWEYRERARVRTYSAALCWAACDRLGQIAHRLRLSDRAQYWHVHAVAIRDKILAEAWDEKCGALTGALGHPDLDASVLLCAGLGLLASTDARFRSTCDVIGRELMRNGRIMRYSADDDFGAPETAFLACSFWYIGALCLIGRKDERRRGNAQA